jgi:PAS domain S-box-containing protein
MVPHSLNGAYLDGGSQVLWEDGERVFRRGWRLDDNGRRRAVLIVAPAAEHPSRSSLDRLTHEYELKDQLDAGWAVRPLDLVRDAGRTALVLEDVDGEPLDRLLGAPMEVGRFLRLAIATTAAIGKLHLRSVVHKDIKPANLLVNVATDEVRLTGFGIASRLPRERQSPHPPETIAGTLAFMAPEQTGRMNRSVDSRSDLYALGVTFYQMLTGVLPFAAADAMEWVHCHLARRPAAPAERLREIPGVISAIVMKLLAKMAEDRYQTAAGLESDLRRCQTEWQAQCRLDDFPLGERDTPDRLLIPEKLHGRQREVGTLLAAFDRIVKGGAPELVLVSGYSGIGKSSVVNELQPVLVPPRGLFAAGKFDQYKRDIPYSTLAQAFASLIRPLLGKSEADLAPWRGALRETLGPNTGLIVDLIAELKLITGEPPPVPELPPQDAKRRFQLVFRQFIGVFARPEHPLALFLDDLQWLDAATLDLLEDLLNRSDLRNLLLIGAYRDNEVTAAHPLMRKLEAIRETGRVQDIKLGPLTIDDLGGLVADSLRTDAEQAGPLAALVYAKTDGNPFFVIQFLHVLADEGLLAFDHEQARWSFDLGGIHAKGYTDNVVELLAGKLTRLPRATQDALRQFACLGNTADVATLSIVLRTPDEQMHAALWEAVRQQLIERLDRSYKFVHDRVQEAAYALIPEELRAEAHLTIGRLLVAEMPPEKRDDAIFEIVNQLNRGAPLITSPQEREQLAELNLAAGKRAKASSAYVSALAYLGAGAALLPGDAWERRQDLAFELALHPADCEVCTGALQAAEERLGALAMRAVGIVQRCAVGRRRVDLYTMLGAGERAVAVALECLRHVGIDWSMHPTELETRREYERTWSLLGSRAIEDVVNLPLMQDPEALATLDMLTKLSLPAEYTDENLVALSICRATNLSLERGNNDAAPVSYAAMGMIASARFGDHEKGYRLGKMACDLVERRGLNHFGGRAYNRFAVVVPWTRPLAEAIDPSRRAFEMAKRHGEPTFASFSSRDLVSVLLAVGHPLDQVEHEAEQALEFVLPFGLFLDRMSAPLALIRMLRGRTTKFGSLDDGRFTERSFEERATGEPSRAFLECYYWIRKLQARFFAGDFLSAVDAAGKVDRWYAASPPLSLLMLAKTEYHFYAALARAACCEPMGPDPYPRHCDALANHEQHLQAWAAYCPQNFAARATLVGAEIAGIERRPLDAMNLYERAIAAARTNGSVPDEAIACELAARFYQGRGSEDVAHLYLGNARRAYLRWGADGKVRQLDQLHPGLRQDERAPGPTGTIEAPVEQLDLATVIEVSQALSGEMALEKLIDKLMRAAIEHAGAERGLLISPQGDELRIDAEATARGEDVAIKVRDDSARLEVALPESLIRYVMRTRETVILDDALSSQSPFAADPYVVQRRARSILCLPLINQGKLIGILYLENNLTPRVFTPERTTVLKVLASQAAISLVNLRLYHDLADREARIRRLWDSNILGICIWNIDGAVVSANDEFLRMLQYDHDDVAAGRLNWAELTPAEWRETAERAVAALRSTGSFQPFEKEYLRRDGSRLPVLVGGALFEEGRNEGVAFVLDLTERKRAETALRESEERFRDYAETASDWLWEMGPDHKLTMLSGNAFGSMTSGRLGTAAWERALDLETEPEKWRAIRATMDAHKPFRDFVYLAAGRDGPPMYVKASGKPVFGTKGEFRGYRGIGTDVTEIVRAHEALRESEKSFRDYAETASDWFWEIGTDYRFTLLTENAFGSDAAKRIGTACWDHALDLETEPEKWRLVQETLESRKPFRDFVYCGVGGNGSPMYVRASGKPVFDSNGEFRGYRGTGSDVTAIIRAQEALRESERSLREAIDGIPGLVTMLAPNGDVEALNRQLVEYCGPQLEELKTWDTNGIVHIEDVPHVADVFTRAIASGVPYQFEARLRRFDGEYRWFDFRGIPVRDASDRVARWYVLLTDVEDRTRALARLQQMQSDFAHMNRVSIMGELAASLSHEITQPIASARNNARAAMNFLNRKPPDLREVREALDCVVGDADRAGNIIGRIRDQIRKAPPRKEHFDLNAAITEVIVLARSAILRNGVSVQTRLADQLPPVHGDRVQLQQVVLNLFLNAAEAMGSVEAGVRELSISTGQDVAGVLVAVRDSGPGIDPTHLERVFDAFYTTKSSGTGMGLSICRSIIDAHGGRLWAEANEPHGAVFQFILPGAEARS